MTGHVNIEAEDGELLIRDGERLLLWMTPAMAIHAGLYILRCIKGDCTAAVANIEQTLRMERPQGVSADDVTVGRFEMQCFPEDQEVTLWLDSRILMTLGAEDAEEVALRMLGLGVELITAEHRVLPNTGLVRLGR